MIKDAICKSHIFNNIVVCPLRKVPYPELPAVIADFLVFRESVNTSLVIGKYDSDMYLILKSLDRTVNSADVMRQLVEATAEVEGMR